MESKYAEISRQLGKYKNVQGLMKYINKESLKEEHDMQSSNKAVGVDKTTKGEYGYELDKNLEKLISEMKKFAYKPKAVRRTYIPKSNGELRPLGIPAYEDKLVQGVMSKILNEIYEPIFLNNSYGFRRNRDCHMAIKVLDDKIMRGRTNFIVDADIKGFFDNVNHEWLIKFLEHKIKDQDFIRYIKRFLKAGIIEDMKYYESEKGTPQGGLISPVLANVYLHYVLDLWFELYIKVKCNGKAHLIRYADDFVACFEKEEEAEMYFEELKERLAKFNLSIEESKSKIIPFGGNANSKETFDFLGFTHYNGKTRNGYYKCGHRTSMKKSKLKVENMRKYIRKYIHQKVADLIDGINRKLRGLFNYYGISDNMSWMRKFAWITRKELYRSLKHKSQRSRMNGIKMDMILKYKPLLEPRITHSLWQ